MSAETARGPQGGGRDDVLLPADLDAVLEPRLAAHFGIDRSRILVIPVHSYYDGSGAVLIFSAPHHDGSPVQRAGRADQVVISAVVVDGGTSDLSIESVREEHDHPGVRVIPVDSPGWTVVYAVVVDAGASYVGGSVLRFVRTCGSAALSVTLSGVHGPLDHGEAHDLAQDILHAAGWADDASLTAVAD